MGKKEEYKLKNEQFLQNLRTEEMCIRDRLYAEIDRNKMFVGTAAKEDRSRMNICFVMAPEYKELEADFLKFATEKGMVGIKGHRSVGGFRGLLTVCRDLPFLFFIQIWEICICLICIIYFCDMCNITLIDKLAIDALSTDHINIL